MRRSFPLTLVAMALARCSSTNETPDAGSDASLDVQLTDSTTNDAPSDAPSDALADAGPDAKPSAPATVTVYHGAAAVQGAIVVFYKDDGTALAPITTGQDGKATTNVSAGWSVTASGSTSVNTTSYTSLTTFVDIEPGDDLAAYVKPAPVAVVSGTESFSFSAFAGATQYVVTDACSAQTSSSASSVALTFGSACENGGKIGVVGLAHDSSGNVIAATQATNVTPVDQAVMSLSTWSSVSNANVAFTGSPPTGATASFANLSFVGSGFVYGQVDKQNFALDGGAAVSFPVPSASVITANTTIIGVSYAPANGLAPMLGKLEQASLGGGFALDFGQLPPKVHDPVITSDGSGNVTVAFTADASITTLDGMELDLEWGSSSNLFTWTIVAPPAVSTALPKVTSNLAAVLPPTTPKLDGVILKKGTPFGTYAKFRANDQTFGLDSPPSSSAFSFLFTGILSSL